MQNVASAQARQHRVTVAAAAVAGLGREKTVSHIERRPPVPSSWQWYSTLMQERKSLSAVTEWWRRRGEKEVESHREKNSFLISHLENFTKLYMSPQLHFGDTEVDKASYQLVLLGMTEYSEKLRLWPLCE